MKVCDTTGNILYGVGGMYIYEKGLETPVLIPEPCTDPSIPKGCQKPQTNEKRTNQPIEPVHGAIQTVF